MRDEDELTLAEIAAELTNSGYRNCTGKNGTLFNVKRILDRADSK